MPPSVATRLAAFALVLAGTFGSAYALGERLPGHQHSGAGGHTHDHGGHSGHGSSPVAPVVRGSTALGYLLVTDTSQPGVARFHLERGGARVADYTETHGAMVHVVLLRPDLGDFHHVHPGLAADGSWTVELPDGGPWTVVSEVQPRAASAEVVVAAEVGDAAGFVARPLPEPASRAVVEGLTVTLDVFPNVTGSTQLVFSVDPSGGLEPYLGMPAHLVIAAAGDLAFAHLHPVSAGGGRFGFSAAFVPGTTYRAFLQFGRLGQVVTVPFTVVAT